jgi:polyisoprenoid-binding protein YceI
VVASHDVRGYLAPAAGRADLYLRLDRLVVDERDLRAEAQFDTQPSAEAIAATRVNMLDKLGAGAHPWALVAVRDVTIDASGFRMNATLTLNGSTRAMDLSPQIVLATDEVGVDGRVALEQTNFGITPFSILGGALQVQDRVAVRFRIRARRVQS